MSANGPTSDWSSDVIAFLSRNLHPLDQGEGWQHMFSTAYQIGCEALAALGQAEKTEWGAVPREDPGLPAVLPRWDDVCVAVLWLAEQQGKLAYRLQDGTVPPQRIGMGGYVLARVDAPPPPAPNIAAACGLGPAYAASEVLSVLVALGLVAQGSWTSAAETVLWRGAPRAWELDVSADPRFAYAVEEALATMPDGIGAEMDRLTVITEEDVAAAVAQHAAAIEEARAKYGPKARLGTPHTADQARRSLEFWRRHELDWLFFRHWRLAEGWLSPEEEERALKIFHDRLASAVQRAVTMRRYPGSSVLLEKS